MLLESIHALVALSAMFRSRGLEYLAEWTNLVRGHSLEQFDHVELVTLFFLQVAWLLFTSHEEGNKQLQ